MQNTSENKMADEIARRIRTLDADPVREAAEQIIAQVGDNDGEPRTSFQDAALTVARAYLSVARPDVTEFAALAELAEKAEQRIPGEWKAAEQGDYGDFDGNSRVILGDDMRLAVVHWSNADDDAVAEFIAAANPATIKRLLAALAERSRAKQSEDVTQHGKNKRLHASGKLRELVDAFWAGRGSKIDAAYLLGDGGVRVEWSDKDESGHYHISLDTLYGDARAAAATAGERGVEMRNKQEAVE